MKLNKIFYFLLILIWLGEATRLIINYLGYINYSCTLPKDAIEVNCAPRPDNILFMTEFWIFLILTTFMVMLITLINFKKKS